MTLSLLPTTAGHAGPIVSAEPEPLADFEAHFHAGRSHPFSTVVDYTGHEPVTLRQRSLADAEALLAAVKTVCEAWRSRGARPGASRPRLVDVDVSDAELVAPTPEAPASPEAEQARALWSGEPEAPEALAPAAPTVSPLPSDPATRAPEALPACPDCGADMVRRYNRQTGGAFLGCTRYRAGCRGTRPEGDTGAGDGGQPARLPDPPKGPKAGPSAAIPTVPAPRVKADAELGF